MNISSFIRKDVLKHISIIVHMINKKDTILKFFTIWQLVFVIFSPLTSEFLNLPLLSTIVLLVGSYFSFIYPTYYVVGNKIIRGNVRLFLVDIFLHLLPFMYVILSFPINGKSILNSIGVLLVYSSLFNPIDVYFRPL